MHGTRGDNGCRGSNFQSISCQQADCQEFVEYDQDDQLETEIIKICPDIYTKQPDIQGNIRYNLQIKNN